MLLYVPREVIDMKRTTIYLDEETHKRLEAYAERVGSDMSKQIRIVVNQLLSKKDKAYIPMSERVAK